MEMGIGVYLGVALTCFGLICIFFRRSQNSENETDISIKDFKLKGGPGSILVILGVILVVLDSIYLPGSLNHKSTGVTPTESTLLFPSAEIEKVWFEPNVSEKALGVNSLGMRVHMKFRVRNLKNKICGAGANFYFPNSAPLRMLDVYNMSSYNDGYGNLATNTFFTPDNDDKLYDDLQLFMPYKEFYLNDSQQLKFNVGIWNNNTWLARTDWIYFDYLPP
jgi:hypothetical protein